jgi:hypothetical protein
MLRNKKKLEKNKVNFVHLVTKMLNLKVGNIIFAFYVSFNYIKSLIR